jgi:ethanolamine transporter EutH
VKTLRNVVLSVLFAVGILVAIGFIFTTTSVIESFQLYEHDVEGGFALALLELVLALLAAAVGGLLCFHRLCHGCWSLRPENQAR